MYKYFSSIILIILFSCNFNQPKSFFEFDTIDHYVYKHNDDIAVDSINKINYNDLSNLENFKYNIIRGYQPKKLVNVDFENQLLQVGFIKKIINNESYNEIDSIFSYKNLLEFETTVSMCEPNFRDVLIFKNKGLITGLVKICFECNHNIIIGSNQNIEEFGSSSDYDKLKKILYQQ